MSDRSIIRKYLVAVSAVAVLTAGGVLSGCSKAQGDAGSKAAASGGPSGAPSALPAAVLTVAPQTVTLTLDAVGQTEGAKTVDVRARVQGILQKKLFQEGDNVREGQALFQIERAPFEVALAQAKANLAQAQAKQEQAQREQTRLKGLLEQKAISQREFDDADSNAKLNVAATAAAQAQVRQAELNLNYTLVTAPVAGVTGRALQSEGSLVNPSGAEGLLTTLSQVNPIWVRFSFSPSEVAKLPNRSPKDIKQVRLMMPDGSDYPVDGVINFAASTVDPRLGTISLRAEFKNPQGAILPGQFVRVRVSAGQQADAVAIPQSAVLQNDQGRFVWVLGADNKTAPRPVVVGDWSGSNWVIQQGLKAGDRVVIDNLLKVRPGTVIKPITQ